MNKKPIASAVNRALYGAAALTAAAALPAVVQAQEEVEEIIVTGTRIPTNPNLVTSSPVTTVTAQEIRNVGITRVEDLVNDLPQIVPEFDSTTVNGATGSATLDLRGLGAERTLVMINGHRMGFGDRFALSPDINQIPGGMVERVEVLTGGASSVYGADAVAGVVNFIMKDDFEGFELSYQFAGYSTSGGNDSVRQAVDDSGFVQAPSSHTGGYTRNLNFIMGVNSPDDRGNVTAYFGYRDIDEIFQADRDFSACALSSTDGETCAGSANTPDGLFTPFEGGADQYFTVAGDQFVPWDYNYYNYGPLNYFQRPDERYTAGVFGHYEVNEKVEAYTEMMFMDDVTVAQIAPSGSFFESTTLNCDNPLMSAQQLGVIGCGPGIATVPWYNGRRNVEGGPRFDDIRHTNLRYLLGFRGDLTDTWSYDLFFNQSRVRSSETYNNDVSITKFTRAIDVVDDGAGNAVCRSTLTGADPDCVPWNIFQTGAVTQEAVDYIRLPLFARGDLEQDQVVAYVAGDLADYGWVLPTAVDGVTVVFGLEYRDESINFNPDPGYRSGDAAGQGGATGAYVGGITVKEFFFESNVPLVQDRPGFQSLSLDLRYRSSDYNTPDVTTDTYNIGGAWRPVDSIMFRGGFSRAIRAPNILELFDPITNGLWTGDDDCSGAAPVLSAAECANTGVLPGQYGSIPGSPAGQYNAKFGGNLNLSPEESDSYTFGLVFTPSGALDGLTISLDYWNAEVTDAISQGIGEQTTLNECAATGDPVICGLISRGPNGNLWIDDSNAFVISTNINIGFFEAAGTDLTASYDFEVGNMGSVLLQIRGSYLETWDETPLPGGITNKCAGAVGRDCDRPRPEWKHMFNAVWATPWDLDLLLGWRYQGETKELAPTRYTADAQNYIDLGANYTTDFLGGTTSFNVGISNVFDESPPVSGFMNNADFSAGNTFPGIYDAMGQYWFVGITQSF